MAIGNPINLTSNVEGKSISVSATAGQTQFTVTGGYRINQISVYRNGVRLVDGRDFTATDGSIVTLLSAASVDDVVEFQVFDDFRVSDALNVNSGGTVNGDVTVNGALTVSTTTITGTATTAQGLTGSPDIAVTNITAGIITATGNISAVDGTFTGNVTVGGTLTYEDVTNIDAVGVITARSDVSIADKIIHTGDTDTAIRFPAGNTFTVETAGSEAIRVDSSQRLLVNTATTRNNYDNGSVTSNLLHVERTAASGNAGISICANAGTAADVGAILYMGRTSATSNGGSTIVENNDLIGRISFQGADGSELVEAASIKVDVDGAPGSNDMPGRIEFHTTADGAASATERVRITSSGNMGVGEDSPQQRLHVSSTASTYIQVQNTGNSVNAYYGVDTGGAWAGSSTNHPFKLHTNNTERLRIESNGYVKAQAGRSYVQTSGSGTGDTDGVALIVDGNEDAYLWNYENTSLRFGTNNTERARITGIGSFGINEDDPENQLHVHDDTSYQGIFVNGNGAPRINFARSTTTTAEWSVGVDGTDGARFAIADSAGNTAKLIITTGGNLSATGTISDSIGNVRSLVKNSQSGGTSYTLVAGDAGKIIDKSSGGGVTVPNGVLSAGDMITILNNSGSDFTITQGSSFSLYNTADASTGNKTLAGRGIATIYFLDGSNGYISGSGMS